MKKFNTQKNVYLLSFLIFFPFSLSHLFAFEISFLPYTTEETVLMQGIQVLSEGKDACGNNPAGCGMENKKSFSFGYTLWRSEENLYSLGLFLPKKFANIGFKLKYADLGETELVSFEPVNIKKESLYSVIFHTSFGKEIFFPGFYLGVDFSLGGIKLDKNLNLAGSKIGFVYILNFESTELHLGSVLGIDFFDSKNLETYGFGTKYFLPEYRTFLNLSYSKNLYSFITTSIETEIFKNFVFLCGYETTTEKSLTNYSFGLKSVQKNFDIVLGTRYNFELGWTISIGVNIK